MNIFSLEPENLNNLGQERSVVFFRRLLWAEASRVNIGRNLMHNPGCINVGDGGLDAFIEKATPSNDEVMPFKDKDILRIRIEPDGKLIIQKKED